MKEATLVHVVKGDYTLKAWQLNKIIGPKAYGGIVELGQTVKENALEEVKQETGHYKEFRLNKNESGGIIIKPEDLRLGGRIDFYNGTEEEVPFGSPSIRVYCFVVTKFSGVPINTIEMIHHRWVNFRDPYVPGIMGDELFIKDLLTGWRPFGWIRRMVKRYPNGTLKFEKIISHEIDLDTDFDIF